MEEWIKKIRRMNVIAKEHRKLQQEMAGLVGRYADVEDDYLIGVCEGNERFIKKEMWKHIENTYSCY